MNTQDACPLRYLVIEDSKSDAMLFEHALREARNWPKYEICWRDNLASGISTAAQDHFDVILLDLNLPDSEGISTFRSLLSAFPKTAIIILTARGGEELAAQAMHEGAQDVIFKDRLDPYWVAHTISRAISRNALLQRIILAEEKEVLSAQNANQAKTDFLSALSHELRSPLSSILMAVEAVCLESRLSIEHEGLLKMALRNGRQLLTLINDLLDLSKIEAGCITLEHGAVNIKEEIQEVVSTFLPGLRGTSKELKLRFQTDIPLVIISDPIRFRQILSNLISNAIKFTTKGDIEILIDNQISITGASSLRIEVRDTGIGMTKEQIDKIFLPFSQADASIMRRFGGTGLGLSLAKRFANALGGDVSLMRSAPGKGSTFIFDLPYQVGTKLNEYEPIATKFDQGAISKSSCDFH